MRIRRRNGGKFRNTREKLRQKEKKAAKQVTKSAELEKKERSKQDVLQKRGTTLVATRKGVYKVSSDGHLRGKLKQRKLRSLRDGDIEERKFVEWASSVKGKKKAGRLRPPRNKKMTSTSSDDEDDAEMMAALTSVAVDSAAVVQGAADLAKRKDRRVRGASKSAKKSKRRIGDSSDEDPELAHYQIRTQEMLHRHLDQTFGAIVGDDSSEEEGKTNDRLTTNGRQKRKGDGNDMVKKAKKQRSLTIGNDIGATNETNASGTANIGGSGEAGIRLFTFSSALSKSELKEASKQLDPVIREASLFSSEQEMTKDSTVKSKRKKDLEGEDTLVKIKDKKKRKEHKKCEGAPGNLDVGTVAGQQSLEGEGTKGTNKLDILIDENNSVDKEEGMGANSQEKKERKNKTKLEQDNGREISQLELPGCVEREDSVGQEKKKKHRKDNKRNLQLEDRMDCKENSQLVSPNESDATRSQKEKSKKAKKEGQKQLVKGESVKENGKMNEGTENDHRPGQSGDSNHVKDDSCKGAGTEVARKEGKKSKKGKGKNKESADKGTNIDGNDSTG